jgi:hypothetical protein
VARSRRATSTVLKRNGFLNAPPLEEVLGSGDIQSLADLNSSYEIVSDMRAVPFRLEDITRLVAASAGPLVPLLLTIFPLEELIMLARQDRVLNVSKGSKDFL